MTVHDDRGRAIALAKIPERVVSLVPSISETLWHLGIGERLVAVTRYCVEPAEVRSLPRCGGTKNPDCEAVLALRPDLVFMSEEENRREDYERLVAGGVAVFISFPRRMDDIADWIRRLGAAIGRTQSADSLAAQIEAALGRLRAEVAARCTRPRVFCPIWKNPWMSFNADTYAHAVIEACGAESICAGESARYPEISLAEVEKRRPDLVLLPDEPYPFGVKDLPDLAPLLEPRGPVKEARLVDGQALSWYGARTPRALEIFREVVFRR